MQKKTQSKLRSLIERIIREETDFHNNLADRFHAAVQRGDKEKAFRIVANLDDDDIMDFEQELKSEWGREYADLASDIYSSYYEGPIGTRSAASALRKFNALKGK